MLPPLEWLWKANQGEANQKTGISWYVVTPATLSSQYRRSTAWWSEETLTGEARTADRKPKVSLAASETEPPLLILSQATKTDGLERSFKCNNMYLDEACALNNNNMHTDVIKRNRCKMQKAGEDILCFGCVSILPPPKNLKS